MLEKTNRPKLTLFDKNNGLIKLFNELYRKELILYSQNYGLQSINSDIHILIHSFLFEKVLLIKEGKLTYIEFTAKFKLKNTIFRKDFVIKPNFIELPTTNFCHTIRSTVTMFIFDNHEHKCINLFLVEKNTRDTFFEVNEWFSYLLSRESIKNAILYG